MARINIEDCVLRDNRFADLMIRLGSKRMALGALTEAWMLAQQFYLKLENQRLIPLKVWNQQRMAPEILEVGLAETRLGGIYMCGAEKQFAWLLQRSNAGRKARGARVASIKPTYDTADLNKDVMLNGRQRPFNDRHRAPSSSSSSSLTSSSSSLTSSSSSIPFVGFRKEENEERNLFEISAATQAPNYVSHEDPHPDAPQGDDAPPAAENLILPGLDFSHIQNPKPPPTPNQQTQAAYAHYIACWKKAYPGEEFMRQPADIGKLAKLVKDQGLEKTLELTQAYFGLPDQSLRAECHPINLFVHKLASVNRFRLSGQFEARNFKIQNARSNLAEARRYAQMADNGGQL